jgi:calcineurin-like phosphoesterase family protein
MNAMYNIGFDVVLNSASIYIAGEEVTLSHCPLRGIPREDTTGMRNHVPGENWHGESRHRQYSLDNRNSFALHGHLHSQNIDGKMVKQNKQWDIGVVGNSYRPVSIGQVESWITNYKNGK